MRVLSCPPMADAVGTLAIFQQHFPSMLAMECDGEGDLGILCMSDARPFGFPLSVHCDRSLERELSTARLVRKWCCNRGSALAVDWSYGPSFRRDRAKRKGFSQRSVRLTRR